MNGRGALVRQFLDRLAVDQRAFKSRRVVHGVFRVGKTELSFFDFLGSIAFSHENNRSCHSLFIITQKNGAIFCGTALRFRIQGLFLGAICACRSLLLNSFKTAVLTTYDRRQRSRSALTMALEAVDRGACTGHLMGVHRLQCCVRNASE